MMRAILLGLALWCCAALAHAQSGIGQDGSERFERADITIRVAKDGSLSFREELDYVKPRGVTKRGIFRELPSKVREGAITHKKQYKLTLATRNGQRENVTHMGDSGTTIWRLGSASVFLEEGVQRYVLEYNSDDWIVRYDDLDEIRWNVWGEYWGFPVKELTGRIILPESASPKQVAAYTGRFGSRDNDLTLKTEGNVISFSANRPLRPGEAATVAVGVEKGVFDPLSAAELSARWWRANGALLGMALVTPGILLFYILNWMKVGRDPVKPPVFARYEAPKNYSAAAVHRILRKGIRGDAALISTLLSLAIKKYIKIDVTKKTTRLTRLHTQDVREKKNPEEKILMTKIFKTGSDVVILRKNKPHSRFHKATLFFRRHLHKAYSTDYHRVNGKYVFGGIALSLVGLIAVMSSFHTPSTEIFWLLVLGVVLVNFVFIFLMPAPTKKGAQVKSEIEGFKLYLETAEKLRLNAAEIGTDQVPPMTIERYESFLPYAVALDVEKPWTKHFEKTLPIAAKDYQPSYYNSYRSGGIGGGVRSMQKDIYKSLSSGVSSARPVQTSSGGGSSSGRSYSGGGGFSGGGGGGGGGGSW